VKTMSQCFRGSKEEGVVAQARQIMRRMEPSRLKQEIDEYKAEVLL
jgi:hypothetical protein